MPSAHLFFVALLWFGLPLVILGAIGWLYAKGNLRYLKVIGAVAALPMGWLVYEVWYYSNPACIAGYYVSLTVVDGISQVPARFKARPGPFNTKFLTGTVKRLGANWQTANLMMRPVKYGGITIALRLGSILKPYNSAFVNSTICISDGAIDGAPLYEFRDSRTCKAAW